MTCLNLALDRFASLFIEEHPIGVSSLLARPIEDCPKLGVSVGESVSDQDRFERDRDGRRSRFPLVESLNDLGDMRDVGTGVRFPGEVERNILELGELFVEKLVVDQEKKNGSAS